MFHLSDYLYVFSEVKLHCLTRVARNSSKRVSGAGLTLADLKALNLAPVRSTGQQ